MACACQTKSAAAAVQTAADESGWTGTLTVRHERPKPTVTDHLFTVIVGVIATYLVIGLLVSLVRR